MLDGFPQPRLVIEPCQFVVIRALFQQNFMLLAAGDHAQHTVQPNRLSGFRKLSRCALVNPAETAFFRPHPVFAVKGFTGGKMFGQTLEPFLQVIWINAFVKGVAICHSLAGGNTEHIRDTAKPLNFIAYEIPGIDHVTGTGQRGFNGFRFVRHNVHEHAPITGAHISPTKLQRSNYVYYTNNNSTFFIKY